MKITNWYTLSLLLHLTALAFWLGGLTFFLVVFGPAVNGLKPGVGARTLNHGRRALEAVSWSAIGLLTVTGIINFILVSQATGAPQGEFYTMILSLKLLLFFTMLLHHCLQVFKYGPKIAALTSRTDIETDSWPEELRAHWRKWFTLLKINAALGPIAVLLGVALVKG